MYSLSIEFPKDKFVESETPQSQQKYKGWYWDSDTKKFYRWDNSPRSSK